MKSHLKYWHTSNMEGSEIVESVSGLIPESYMDHSLYGPFDTYREAKRDALDYHRVNLETAKRAMYNLRAMRKGKNAQTD